MNADPGVWAWPPPRPVRTDLFAPAGTPKGESYHRLGRTSRYGWWTPPATLVVLGVLMFFLWVAMALAVTLVAVIGGSGLAPESMRVGEVARLAFGLLWGALFIPIVVFLVRVVQWRRTGSLMSVEGRTRSHWLMRCVILAIVPVGLCTVAYVLLADRFGLAPVSSEATGDGRLLLAAMVVIVLLVPFQSVAEELTLRGLVMQLVGALGARATEPGGSGSVARVLRSPWPAVLAGGTLFPAIYAATHPGEPWTVAALTVLGLALSWLTWRTGGLEAAIGLHVVSALTQFTLCVLQGGIAAIGTGVVLGAGLSPGTGTPLVLALTLLQTGMYVLLVRRASRRDGIRAVSAA
ncbi:type II CAAX endopeptidase family protein [Nocardiopsis sp. N85]|uniref:CPBP family intramembrane glutamic endopeptidase n=1 Tax=Nocardiopsis sp. N85 TaxID=3029400 RepID=UPI00237FCCDE|nr:type II CAAX endopeptidase family protein [Nocardiopsis sp. N85]MDE3721155.1 type II CAAX endopeptidase family protein [Nocardiopsis sp. N85]